MKAMLLLRPGETIMERLRFTQKLLLSILVIAIPLAYLTYTYVADLNQSITFVEGERLGLRFVRPAVDHIKEVQKHRGTASRLLNGDAGARQALLEVQATADEAARQLDALVKEYGSALPAAGQWSSLRSTWENIKARVTNMNADESFKAHTEYIAQVMAFVNQVSNDSGLTLDPELDSYYLMTMVTDALPWVTEYMGQQRAVASGVAARLTATVEEQIQLYALKGNADGNLTRVTLALNQVFSANPQLRGQLEAKGKAAQDAIATLQTELEQEILEATEITVSGEAMFATATRAIDAVYELYDGAVNSLADVLQQRSADMQARRATMIPLIAGGLLLSFYLLLAFSTSARRSLDALEQTARRVADGDLTRSELLVTSRDEVGRVTAAFNQTLRNLRDLIQSVTTSSQAVLAAGEELSAASEQSAQGAQGAARAVGQVAGGASEQAQASDEMRRTMEQLQETIQQIATGAQRTAGEVQRSSHLLEQMVTAIEQVATNAQGVADSTSQAASTARNGADVVQHTVRGMERIRQVVGESAERIRNLEQLSTQIGEITQMISGIAEQTNLLALNAAIEAARAGEHGRGFAVVAEEVRKLAERSATSAREITDLINNIQTRTAEAVKAMEAGTHEVEEGSKLATDAGQALSEILKMVERAAGDVQNISATAQQVKGSAEQVVKAFDSVAAVTEENTAATEEMAAGTTQVTKSVERVAAVSQENAAAAEEVSSSMEELNASAEEVATSAQNLSKVAQELQQYVARFKV